MIEIKRQRFVDAVRQRDERWQAYELRWLRYDFEIFTEPRGRIATIWPHRSRNYRPALTQDLRGRLETVTLPVAAEWPKEGVFVPKGWPASKPLERYNPVDVAKNILLDVQRTEADNPQALLRFVTKWGRLGIGIPDEETFPFDGVAATGQCLVWLQRWLEAYHELKRGRKTEAAWPTLAEMLRGALAGIQPDCRPMKRGLDPLYRVPRLLDALWLEVWEIATEGKRLRRCPECRALFLPGRANQDYCTHQCANRPTVRRAKQKRKVMMAQGSMPQA